MSAERHQIASDVFLQVVDLPADERTRALARLCGADDALRREVESLLASDSHTSPLDEPPGGTLLRDALPRAETPGIPERIGEYQVLGVLGQGGMGTVYRARQPRPSREVALKVINPALLTPAMLRRFEFEARVLAELRHPGIAQIYESGTANIAGQPTPFFAMELVEGQPLTRDAESRGLDRRARLVLLRRVCDAVRHAHQKGVIHRDLKPANVVVDASGQPKLLDFGIARATREDLAQTVQTRPGQLIGTVPYMSPEQLSGELNGIDTRADVYALGVIAFELLTGRLPYELRDKSVIDAIQTIGRGGAARLSQFDRTLRGDLETIVARAIDPDLNRRYASVDQFDREIERYLNDEAIEARRDSRLYVLRKAIVRHRGVVGTACAFVVLLGVATGVSISLALAEARQRRIAEQNAEQTRAVAEFQSKMLANPDLAAMGQGLRTRLREQVTTGLARQGIGEPGNPRRRTQAEIDAALAEYDRATASTQMTDVARGALDEFVLGRAGRAIESGFADQPLVRAQLHASLGATYHALGLVEPGEAELRKSLELRRASLPPADVQIADSAVRLARLLTDRGQDVEAQQLVEEALSIVRAAYGERDARVAELKIDLAAVRTARDDLAGAEQLEREALSTFRESPDAPPAKIANALNSLGELLGKRGDFAGAEQAHRESLALRRDHPGDEDDIAIGLNNLANLLTSAGKYAEAEPLQREALERFRRLKGDRHPHTISAMFNLANTLRASGDDVPAEALYRETIALSRQFPAPEDAGLINCLVGLANLMQERGDVEQAEPLLREAVSLLPLDDDAPDAKSATVLNNLAVLLHAKHEYENAEPLYRQAIAMRRAIFGDDHPEVAGVLQNFAALLRDSGKLDEAERVYAEAIQGLRKRGPRHPDLAIPLGGLARVKFERGDYAEAERLQREALELLAAGAPRHERTLWMQAMLARSIARQGRHDEAEKLLLENTAQLESNEGQPPGRARTATIQNLVELYESWNKAQPDAGYDRRAEEWRVKLGGQ
ncbi:MAG: serine/threonine-protein kinase [Phycisphaerae bacterium]